MKLVPLEDNDSPMAFHDRLKAQGALPGLPSSPKAACTNTGASAAAVVAWYYDNVVTVRVSPVVCHMLYQIF
jgi:hypothetical protein